VRGKKKKGDISVDKEKGAPTKRKVGGEMEKVEKELKTRGEGKDR